MCCKWLRSHLAVSLITIGWLAACTATEAVGQTSDARVDGEGVFPRAAAEAEREHPVTHASRGPHGGQVMGTKSCHFEVVYFPRQTRVYLFTPDRRPISPRGVRGEVTMQVRGNHREFKYPLRYVKPRGEASQQDYLAVAVDVTRVPDGEMTATFDLAGLPDPREPRTRFSQVFALSSTQPKVALATLEDGDRDAVARQAACPVMGARLGSHGSPVKVLVDDRPMYLCCKGCLAALKKDPMRYSGKAEQLRSERGRR